MAAPSPDQVARLEELVAAVAPANPFQGARLNGAGLRALPTMDKTRIGEDQRAHPPFGTNLTFGPEAYTRVHQTTGTTGVPLRVPATAEDWRWLRAGFARTLERAGVGRGDRVGLAFSFGPQVQFWGFYEGVAEVGAMALPLGGMDSVQRLESVRDYAASALVCTPSYALHLAEAAFQRGLEDALEPVTRVICCGEPGASLASTRARIEELWGARCLDHAGLTEVGAYGVPCPEHGGFHVDEEFVCELLDGAGADVPAGEQGELVLTALGRTGFPAIRWRTGDVVRSPGPGCPAGHAGPWLPEGIVGRTDDMVVIRGMNVFPAAIEECLREVEGAAGGFRITFCTEPGAMEEVKLEVELDESASARAVQERMRRRLGLRVRVVALRPGILPRGDHHKAGRVFDRRLGA